MEFKEKKSIYIQIADHFSEKILGGFWQKDDRIPSVREMAVQLEVNPNTVMRAYAHLQEQSVIYNKRGIGYFVSPQAEEVLKKMKKEEFIQNVLPEFYKTLQILDMDFSEIKTGYEAYLNQQGGEA